MTTTLAVQSPTDLVRVIFSRSALDSYLQDNTRGHRMVVRALQKTVLTNRLYFVTWKRGGFFVHRSRVAVIPCSPSVIGRPRLYQSNADRQRAYRIRLKAALASKDSEQPNADKGN